jgi:hypothetical protein
VANNIADSRAPFLSLLYSIQVLLPAVAVSEFYRVAGVVCGIYS